MGKGSGTIGFHYLFTFVAGFGRGPIDELHQIVVQEKLAWDGHACGAGVQVINKPDLFGGEQKEGGIQGAFRLLGGAPDQVLPDAETISVGGLKGPVKSTSVPNVKTMLGGLVSEFRGFSAIVFDGLVASMNPYLKEWKFRVRRSRKGWHNDACWYSAKATIYLADGKIHAMNPAHIIYQCLTDPDWGKGEPPEQLFEEEFVYAANLFCSEGLGLCIPWFRQEDVDDFLTVVCNHVGCLLYQERMTGRWGIRVLRADYDPDEIPFFDNDSGLLEILDDDSASAEAVNEVVVTGHDPETDTDFQVRAASNAGWISQGGPISRPMDFKGIPTRDLGLRKAQYELALLSPAIKRFRVKFDRRAWQLVPGSVVRVASARNNIASMVLRLGELTEGPPGTGSIMARAVEDVFAMPATTFTGAAETDWTPPLVDPVPAPADRLVELSYRTLFLLLGPGDLGAFDATDSGIGMMAASPGSGSYLYDLASKAVGDAEYSYRQSQPYSGFAVLATDLGALDTATAFQQANGFDESMIDQVLLIGDEEVLLTAYDAATGAATIARGVGDTIPAAHTEGTSVWAIDDDIISDGRQYAEGETVTAKALPRTSTAVLDEAEATERTVELIGRQARPFPPADVRVDGASIYGLTGEHNEPVLTWAHRDRITQEDVAIGHTEASVGPEAGTTYNVRIYDFEDTLLRETAAIAGAMWTYDSTMQSADGAPSAVRIELESERDGLVSAQTYSFIVTIQTGWGYGWGLNWGGA